MIGGHLVKAWSKEQSKLAKSSAEAELYAANYGAPQGLGLQSVMRELVWNADLKLRVDASATIGLLHRRGLGK